MAKKRRRVVFIVRDILEKYHSKGKIHEVTYDKIAPAIHKYFPDSKFNPFHLAWYKHHFLKGDLDMLYGAEKLGTEK